MFCDNLCNINREFFLFIVFYLNDVLRVIYILIIVYFYFIIFERRFIKNLMMKFKFVYILNFVYLYIVYLWYLYLEVNIFLFFI